MRTQPVVGLLGALVTAEGGQLGQPAAAVGTAKAADRHREAVQDQDLRVEADLAEQLLTELGLDRPQIRRLAREGGSVHTPKGREPVAPVAAEVLVQALVGIDPEELPHALDGQDLAVGQGGPRTALAEPPPAQPLSTRQYTVMSSVVASMLDPRTRGDGLTAKRTGVTTHQTRTPS